MTRWCWLWVLVFASVFATVGCGDDDLGPLTDDTGGSDGGRSDVGEGSDAAADAQTSDAAMTPDPEPLPPSELGGLSPDQRYEDPDLPLDASACYDGLNNDEAEDSDAPEAADCDDPDCQQLASCCVGRSGESVCCQGIGSTANLLALAECTPGTSPVCLDDALVFGSPGPFVDDGLALGGDGTFDSGILFDRVADLRSVNLVIDASIRQAECTGACRESAAFGVTAQDSLGTSSHVDPEVALIVSGERRQTRLVVGDTVVRVWDDVETSNWSLELRPDGGILVGVAGSARTEQGTWEPIADARMVVWGHSRNPGATGDQGSRITSLTPHYRLCDIPSAWGDRSPLNVVLVDSIDTRGAANPTVALDASGTPHLVYALGGDLFSARQTDADLGRWFWNRDRALVDTADLVSEPELVRSAMGFRLYYIADDTTTGRRFLFSEVNATADELVGDPQEVVMPPELVDFGHASIAPIEPPGRPERFAMAVETGNGIETLASADGVSWQTHGNVPIELLDADEVSQPSLSVVNRGYQLAVSVRRGARWSIALFASAELTYWRLVEDRALSAGENAERIGVRDMDMYFRDGHIEAVYLGLDGVRTTLHRARRPIPTL